MNGTPSLPVWAQVAGLVLSAVGGWKILEGAVAMYRAWLERRKPQAEVAYVGAQTQRLHVESEVAIINEIHEYAQQLRADNVTLRNEIADLKSVERRMQAEAILQETENARLRAEIERLRTRGH